MKRRHVFSTHHFHESLDCWILVTSHSSLVTRATWNGWISIGSLIIAVISYIHLNFITYIEKHFRKSPLTKNKKEVSRRQGTKSELCNVTISNNLQIIYFIGNHFVNFFPCFSFFKKYFPNTLIIYNINYHFLKDLYYHVMRWDNNSSLFFIREINIHVRTKLYF